MSDLVAEGLDWFAEQMQTYASRQVTYRGKRGAVWLTATLTVGIGSSVLTQINAIGADAGIAGFQLQNPEETQRDYIVVQADLRDVGLWPPQSGDMIDDENDVTDATYRYRVMSIPNQASWRPLAGSYAKMARVHSTFFAQFSELWSDAFAGSGLLTAHAADTGGSYGGGTGTIAISGNRIVAGAATDYVYFTHGETDGTETKIALSFHTIAAADLDGKYAAMGVAVRCTGSGAGLRDGYYCTLKVGYTAANQTTKVLRIFEVASGVETQKASLTLPADIDLNAVYMLTIYDEPTKITAALTDETGEISKGSVGYLTTTYAGNATSGLIFQHHATLASFATPYMDDLTVEA